MAIKTIPKNNDGGWYKPKQADHNILPGDVVEMTGDYAYINLDGYVGTAEKPIVFRNKGLVKLGTNGNYAVIITNSKHFIWDGQGDPAIKYGFVVEPKGVTYISQSITFVTSQECEFKGIEIKHSQVGFFAAPSTGGIHKNVKIHDCYIHDLNNPLEAGRCEAFYIGNTSGQNEAYPARFDNVEIYNNVLDDLYGDGIQIALSENLKIHHNKITNYGKAKLQDQNTGIILGGLSTGEVYENEVMDGSGTGIQVFGNGLCRVYKNKILRTSTHPNCDAVYIANKGNDPKKQRVEIVENEIDGSVRNGIRNTNDLTRGEPGVISGNKITNTALKAIETQIDVVSDVVTPPPSTPKIVFTLNVGGKTYVITDDFKWRYQ